MEKEGIYIHFIETSNSVNKLAGDFEHILRSINFYKKKGGDTYGVLW